MNVQMKERASRLKVCVDECNRSVSAIIIAGGVSRRIGRDKCLVNLAGKPLILHVLDKLTSMVDDLLIVVSSKGQQAQFENVFSKNYVYKVAVDQLKSQSPLVGALKGFEIVDNKYAFLLPCDAPFLSTKVLGLLLELSAGTGAVIPRWPNGNIEPLHAVYNVERACDAAKKVLEERQLDMRSMISQIRNVRYISTLVLQQLDYELETLFNVNSPDDLRKAEVIIQRHLTESEGNLK